MYLYNHDWIREALKKMNLWHRSNWVGWGVSKLVVIALRSFFPHALIIFFVQLNNALKKFRIRETPNLSTDVDSSTETIFFCGLKFFFFWGNPKKKNRVQGFQFIFFFLFILLFFLAIIKIGGGPKLFFKGVHFYLNLIFLWYNFFWELVNLYTERLKKTFSKPYSVLTVIYLDTPCRYH